MNFKREPGRAILEELEGLTRVHGEKESHAYEPIGNSGGRLYREEAVDLIPEHATLIANTMPNSRTDRTSDLVGYSSKESDEMGAIG
jgi:hypothetical protein